MMQMRTSTQLWSLVFSLICWCVVASAQTETPPAADPLSSSQKQVADQLKRLESLLLRSADIESLDNPTRAALLQQAVQLSKQTQLSSMLDTASDNLRKNQLSEAIEQQKASRDALQKLLELLQSENREKRIREQRDQVRRWIEDADRLLRMQSSLRGRTEGGQDSKQAAEDQAKLSDKAQQIASEIDDGQSQDQKTDSQAESSDSEKNDGHKSKPVTEPKNDKAQPEKKVEGANADSGKGEQPPDDQSPESEQGEKSSPDGQPNSNSKESQPGDSQSQSQPSQQNQSSEQGQPGQPNGSTDQPSQNGKPPEQAAPKSPTERAQQQIQQAQQRMQEAEEALKKAEREGAVEKQREAEENLRQAIQQLEEILKQLREEEVKRSLETLSTRLRRMLEMQNKILDETKRLHEIAGDEPDRQVLAQASTLSREQQKVAAEGERAQLLLKEEGSSAAFPEALMQVNRDAVNVANRLDAGDVSQLTLVIETDIVQALEEMVEAVAEIKKENDKKKEQQQSQPGGGNPMDPSQQPLINKLAELRLIRTLQIRVNKRTATLSQMLDNPADPVGQSKARELTEQLQELGKRQDSIEGVTRKIAADAQ